MSFKTVEEFEKKIANFFGSPFAIATDSCTHAIELCLRLLSPNKKILFPKQTYVGVPLLGYKLNLNWDWVDLKWSNFYKIENTNIIDAAVLWNQGSYIEKTFMCLSFQFQKHINIGRGGMILTDDKNSYNELILMSYDGRRRDMPWRDQDIAVRGYHYYMTPESAQKGIEIFENKKNDDPKIWSHMDYPDVSKMKVFEL